MTAIPVLTLHQPWATLVAVGVKTIETRSWSTKYRGRLAIHAAARPPKLGVAYGDWKVFPNEYVYRGTPVIEHFGGEEHPIPAGVIVATCDLVDVLPMADDARARNCLDFRVGQPLAGASVRRDVPVVDEEGNPIPIRSTDRPETILDVSDQLPYGLFEPGRWAWLLDDVVALDEPVPFKGGQALSRKWDPDGVA